MSCFFVFNNTPIFFQNEPNAFSHIRLDDVRAILGVIRLTPLNSLCAKDKHCRDIPARVWCPYDLIMCGMQRMHSALPIFGLKKASLDRNPALPRTRPIVFSRQTSYTCECVVNNVFEVLGLSCTLETSVGADACFRDKIQRKDVLNPCTDCEPSRIPLRIESNQIEIGFV